MKLQKTLLLLISVIFLTLASCTNNSAEDDQIYENETAVDLSKIKRP